MQDDDTARTDDALADIDQEVIEAVSLEQASEMAAEDNETTVEQELTMQADGNTDDGSDPDTNSDEMLDELQAETELEEEQE